MVPTAHERALDVASPLLMGMAELSRRLASAATPADATAGADLPEKPEPSPATVSRSLAEGPLFDGVEGEQDHRLPDHGPLHLLAESAELDHVDVSLLVTAGAPSLDGRFGTLMAAISGRERGTPPTVEDILLLNGLSPWDVSSRTRLSTAGQLHRAGLVRIGSPMVSLLDAPVIVPERVVAGMLGDHTPDPELEPLLVSTAGLDADEVVAVCRALQAGFWNVWIQDGTGGGSSVAASALATLGAPSVVLDLRRLAPEQHLGDVLPVAIRDAVLIGGGVVIGPVDPVRDEATLATLTADPVRPTVLVSARAWDPTRSAAVPVVVASPRIDPATRVRFWSDALATIGVEAPDSVTDLAALRLSPQDVLLAARSAVGAAAAADQALGINHLRAAALAHGSNRLVELAQRVVPQATFDDLVVPAVLAAELRSLPGRHSTRHIVRDEWGLGRGGGRGGGLTCLFSGPSGTGKTLAAEVVANALGVDLFIIDLSQIVDKYIGETEKNLERVFTEAEGVNGVLLFDEADAIFGKRSDVQSSHDRHANVEVAYLLQRMERYDGIAVLTTNLAGNIDEAFARRLDVVCTFKEPDRSERIRLWRQHLPPNLPLADDIDIDLLAEQLDVAGGQIRNITLAAAHAAAVGDRPVEMRDLVTASIREYRKLGRLVKMPELEHWAVASD